MVVTESGLKLPKKDPKALRAFHDYKLDALFNTRKIRKYFKSGGNSDIYSVEGFPYVVKEAFGSQSIWSSIDRMDYLHSLSLTFLPPHIQVPEHYAAIFSRRLNRQYLLMDRACEGITVEDVQSDSSIPTELIASIQCEMRNAGSVLRKQTLKYFPEIDNLLPDFHEGNVIVDLTCDTNGFPYKLWIIDQ